MSNQLPILPPADVTPEQLYMLIVQQNREIAELRDTVKDLAAAWKAASTLISFVKMVGAVAAAVAAVWGAVKIFKGMG